MSVWCVLWTLKTITFFLSIPDLHRYCGHLYLALKDSFCFVHCRSLTRTYGFLVWQCIICMLSGKDIKRVNSNICESKRAWCICTQLILLCQSLASNPPLINPWNPPGTNVVRYHPLYLYKLLGRCRIGALKLFGTTFDSNQASVYRRANFIFYGAYAPFIYPKKHGALLKDYVYLHIKKSVLVRLDARFRGIH